MLMSSVIRRLVNRLARKLVVASEKKAILNINAQSEFVKGKGVEILNTNIVLKGKSKLILQDNVKIYNYDIQLENGTLVIENHSRLVKECQYLNPLISINNGSLKIGPYNIIKASFSIRFGGTCTIGTYNVINEETEIRCDQAISIGDHNMISYQCMIYDTNTHVIYPPEIRRKKTIADFPYIGMEVERPATREITIGNDNWLGKRSVVLKGCTFGDEVILATNAVAANVNADHLTLVGNPAIAVRRKQ